LYPVIWNQEVAYFQRPSQKAEPMTDGVKIQAGGSVRCGVIARLFSILHSLALREHADLRLRRRTPGVECHEEALLFPEEKPLCAATVQRLGIDLACKVYALCTQYLPYLTLRYSQTGSCTSGRSFIVPTGHRVDRSQVRLLSCTANTGNVQPTLLEPNATRT
jgi:hypothetical protein